ncbi:nitronate monooxygenase family protein [Pararhodobacter sp. CCB-MM2]|uniref:NAD(P)H-dependent flavin oxidoreductase n=1 Tax=Pararhodobacter sp. CCB-MM2 TaxID=1786003 RepID=UPI000829D401|nr:nitronate monooxygenase family protein [Pararhodobacter sp. CCB-MM2]
MTLPPSRRAQLPAALQATRLPMVGSPLFIISNPDLVIAQCKAGIIGSFPALNAREAEGEPIQLEAWLKRITEELDRHNQAHPDSPAAPFAVNQIVHKTNTRLERDVEICMRWKVPVWITSLGARTDVNDAAHSVGGIVLHDVINDRFARKAIEKGADGLIAVAAGAGGHTGAQSPFALLHEIRSWFDGPVLLSGSIATGRALLAAQAAGADMGYVGTPFIATEEANAQQAYKQMIVDTRADDIVATAGVTGVTGNYLRPSFANAGITPEALEAMGTEMSFGKAREERPKAWKEIWGAGQGVGAVEAIVPAATLVARFAAEYQAARQLMAGILDDWAV